MNRAVDSLPLTAVLALVFATVGCSNHRGILGVDDCADVPPGAVPEIAGTKVCNWQTVQTENAFRDQMVLYHCDFVGRTSELSPAAKERLARRVSSDDMGVNDWVIEPTQEAELDRIRVQSVMNQLATLGVAEVNVVIGNPPALGLRGPLAEQTARAIGGRGRNGGAGFSAIGNQSQSRSGGIGVFR